MHIGESTYVSVHHLTLTAISTVSRMSIYKCSRSSIASDCTWTLYKMCVYVYIWNVHYLTIPAISTLVQLPMYLECLSTNVQNPASPVIVHELYIKSLVWL